MVIDVEALFPQNYQILIKAISKDVTSHECSEPNCRSAHSKKGNTLTALAMLELALLDQAGLQLRDPPASDSGVLGLKACVITPGNGIVLVKKKSL